MKPLFYFSLLLLFFPIVVFANSKEDSFSDLESIVIDAEIEQYKTSENLIKNNVSFKPFDKVLGTSLLKWNQVRVEDRDILPNCLFYLVLLLLFPKKIFSQNKVKF